MSTATLRILLADDSLPSLMATQIMLEKMGHEVLVATDGEKALTLAMQRQFDLILLDEYMPGLRGSEVAARLRESQNENKNCRIIALSGAHTEEESQRLYGAGIDELIIKPVSADRLHIAVAKYFPDSPASIDTDVVAQLYADLGDEVGQKLIGMFVTELLQMQARISNALEDNNVDEYLAVAHILKNSAALYGAKKLASFARDLNENTEQFSEDFSAAANTLLVRINEAHQAANEYLSAGAVRNN
jgi:CheY-like chemotaxis protein